MMLKRVIVKNLNKEKKTFSMQKMNHKNTDLKMDIASTNSYFKLL